MFGRLFGKKKKEIDPEVKKELEKKKREKAEEESKEKLEMTIAKNEKKIADLETKIGEQYKGALAAKKAGQKEKAMRLLTSIKSSKAQITKMTGYNTMLMKRINDMDSMKTDIAMADIFKESNQILENQQQDIEEVMDVMQDAQALSQEINYQQDQINDMINQNTGEITGKGYTKYLDQLLSALFAFID
jgi:hypothetical protein